MILKVGVLSEAVLQLLEEPGHQGCLRCVQLVAGRPHSSLAPQLDCLVRLMALLTPSSCGSPAGVQMLYKSCSAPGVSISKGQSQALIKDNLTIIC